jgi:hypothetical protein
MKRKQLFFSLLLSLFALARGEAQFALVCNDMVSVALDPDCSHTIGHEEILEGSFCTTCDFAVTMDTLPPFGNGPWVPAVVDSSDIGKTYPVRVQDLSTGNACWGNVKIIGELDCKGLTTVNLVGGTPTALLPGDLQISFAGNCLSLNPANTTMNNGQSSVTYDCDDLGVHILQVTTSDPGGNMTSCSTTVVVDDPLSECATCMTCPAAVSVTFQTGSGILVPAFQTGDWSAFDPYGDAVYSDLCTFGDSTYHIEYHTSPHGQNWFVRRWEGENPGGQVIGSCEQVISFPFYQNIIISGKAYIDTLQNCVYDTGEQGVSIFDFVATKLPSNEEISVTPNPDGSYILNVEANGLDSVIVVRYDLPPGFSTSCPTTLVIPATTPTQQFIFDGGLQSVPDCPLMEVSISTPFLRRCQNNTFYIKYCNNGFYPAEDAYVTVEFDPLLEVMDASIPWSAVNGNTYTFELGDVPPFFCQTFSVKAMLDCDVNLGKTLCNTAIVYPHGECGDEAWDGPVVEATAICDGDSVVLSVWNIGTQPMDEEKQYIVIEDVIMYRQSSFQLDAGDSIAIKMPANGSTWRIEANQVSGYPFPGTPAAAVEACGGLNTPGLVTAFSTGDAPKFLDRLCEEVIGSWDPNDKNAVPTGYGAFNTISANTDLEYKIRFQNTGTDTAFRVVIVDTLTALLDPATLEAGASSHPYRLDVYPGGILHFVFDPIILPDSNVNEVASHGFVTFRIRQKPNLPDGTLIENKAAIYFDFNEPVITNMAWHTIGKPFVTVDVDAPLDPGLSVEVMPNPFGDRATIRLEGREIGKGMFTLIDAQGRSVRNQQFAGNQFQVERNDLKAGLYFFRIDSEGRTVARGKMQVF